MRRQKHETENRIQGANVQVVGTHALLSEPVHFANLGLAVVDEQHRFGVGQRAKLQNKNSPAPHVLAMTVLHNVLPAPGDAKSRRRNSDPSSLFRTVLHKSSSRHPLDMYLTSIMHTQPQLTRSWQSW